MLALFWVGHEIGFHIVQNRVFAQVVANNGGHIGIDRLVVGDAGSESIGQGYVAGAVGVEQPATPRMESERNASGSIKSSSTRR